jgi:hypothetical protein
MLYDLHHNKLVREFPWSKKELEDNVTIIAHSYTNAEILNIECNSDKASALKVDGLLKLDVLCKFVNMNGAAACLKEEKELKRHARVYLKYENKSEFKQLNMERLKDTGGNVVMDFFQETTKEEDSKEVKANITAAVEKFKDVISSDGNINVSHTTSSTPETKKMKCSVYSDFPVKEYPSTYEEALKFWKELPSRTCDGIPVVLHLYPLKSIRSLLGKPHPRRQCISTTLADKVCAIIEYLQSVITKCKDLMEEDIFSSLKCQLNSFVENVQEYKTFFVDEISKFRRGMESRDKVVGFLTKHEASVFSRSHLTKWLNDKKEKIKMLQGIRKYLKGTQFVSSGELDALLCNPDIDHVVCLSFRLYPEADIQLLNMEAFLKDDPTRRSDENAPLLDITLVRDALKNFMILKKRYRFEFLRVLSFVAREEPLNGVDR